MSRLLIRNIGLLLSGDSKKPILDADTVLAVDGKIAAVGKQKDIDARARRSSLMPRAQCLRRD